ncbi:hypothetical protein GCM10027456_17920 [Kineosporia babensis]
MPVVARAGAVRARGAGGEVRSYLAALNRARRAFLTGSPGRLRKLGAAGVAGALLAGAGGALAIAVMTSALARADAALEHRDLLQSARVELFRADANAAGAFLKGGLEPTDQRRQFLASLSSASGDVIRAADPQDGRYVQVNRALTEYAGLLETARSSNRQALPVGASYLQIGSGLLNRSVLPPLGAMAAEDTDRADAAFTLAFWAAIGFVVCVLAGGALLIWSQLQLAQLTRSVFTVPAAATSALLAVVTLVVLVAVVLSSREAASVRDGDVRRVADLVEARASAFEARAAENLTLVARGARPEGEAQWGEAVQRVETAVADVRSGAAEQLFPSFRQYRDRHAEMHEADVNGDWRQAVRLATDRGSDGLAASFATFDADSSALLQQVSVGAGEGLQDARGGLRQFTLAMVLAGVIAAGGAAFGSARRLGEYR